MRITRVFFNGDCYLALRAEMDRVNRNRLNLWTPEYLDHLFQPFLEKRRPLPLAIQWEDGRVDALTKAIIDFHGTETVGGNYQMEIGYDSLQPAEPSAMPTCHPSEANCGG